MSLGLLVPAPPMPRRAPAPQAKAPAPGPTASAEAVSNPPPLQPPSPCCRRARPTCSKAVSVEARGPTKHPPSASKPMFLHRTQTTSPLHIRAAPIGTCHVHDEVQSSQPVYGNPDSSETVPLVHPHVQGNLKHHRRGQRAHGGERTPARPIDGFIQAGSHLAPLRDRGADGHFSEVRGTEHREGGDDGDSREGRAATESDEEAPGAVGKIVMEDTREKGGHPQRRHEHHQPPQVARAALLLERPHLVQHEQ
mmetsp:Transcript_13549/g.47834  ORF Transcript_13549/g.47834 Transcript_13549/m.47834 type:complete len:252 (-) Transcript_13549:554-1309(-)